MKQRSCCSSAEARVFHTQWAILAPSINRFGERTSTRKSSESQTLANQVFSQEHCHVVLLWGIVLCNYPFSLMPIRPILVSPSSQSRRAYASGSSHIPGRMSDAVVDQQTRMSSDNVMPVLRRG